MRAVSFNTWNCQGDLDRRLPRMAEGLRSLAADVILLQEVFVRTDGALDVAAFLARALGLHLAFAPARKKTRRHGGRDVPCLSGLAVLSRSAVDDAATISLPSDPADGERIAQLVTLHIESGPLRVLNLHLSHLPGREDLRRDQLAHALARLPGGLALVGGDLNTPCGAPLFDLLAGFQNPEFSDLPGSSLNPVAGPPPAAGIIDHLRVGGLPPGASCRGFFALDRPDATGLYPSDHKALVVDLDP